MKPNAQRKGMFRGIILCMIFYVLFFFGGQVISASGVARMEKGEGLKKYSRISVRIINRGSTAEEVKSVARILSRQDNLKVALGSDKGPELEQTVIVFKEEMFRIKAQEIKALLIEREGIHADLRQVQEIEEKKADIVILLGKFKEAPPN